MLDQLVSVMVPAYNAEAFIQQAIKSVLDQVYPHWEMIVVDDGSTDRTADIVAEINDPRIKLIQQPNSGESAARNVALRHMQGKYIAFLDADDVYLRDHLYLTVSFLEENPHFHGVYTDGFYCDSSLRSFKTLTSRRRGPFQGDVFAEAVRGSDLFGPPVSVVLRRGLIVDQKLQFDEEITIGPDWVFLMDYAASGEFGYLDKQTCLYRLHETNISFRVDLQRRARELAKCRLRSIQMDRFDECPVDVRTTVFYDLLVVLLRDLPEEQKAITRCPQFRRLPSQIQAQIFRLMASQTILSDLDDKDLIDSWLRKSRELDSTDLRINILSGLYRVSPRLCKQVLSRKRAREINPLINPPFADIENRSY